MVTPNWIFVSHSSSDLEKVRQIRNYLESRGHNPLLFFLLSLTNSSLLPELIEKEIRLRSFFVLCDSEASRKSAWVQQEVRLVKAAFPEKMYEEIDLGSDLAPQLDKLLSLSKRSTAFLSFANEDRGTAARLRAELQASDFKVLDVEDLSVSNYLEKIDDVIGVAAQTGYALILLSNTYLTSPWTRAELWKAIEHAKLYRRSNVVPIIIEKDVQTPSEIFHLAPFDLTAGDFDERVVQLIRELKQREMQ